MVVLLLFRIPSRYIAMARVTTSIGVGMARNGSDPFSPVLRSTCMPVPPADLLDRMAATLRTEIGPAVEEPFAKTQAFMAAVILGKLAGQLRGAEADARTADEERRALVTGLRDDLGDTLTTHVGDALAVLSHDGGDAAWSGLVEALYTDDDELGADAVRPHARTHSGGDARPPRPDAGVLGVTVRANEPAEPSMEERIAGYLAGQLGADDLRAARRAADRRRLVARDVAVRRRLDRRHGDRHERGFCLRRDPGNALLREMSDLATQFEVLRCLDDTAVPTPHPYFFEADPAVLGAPFLVMEKVPGVCPSPWGRDGRRFYARRRRRAACCPTASPTRSSRCTPLDWRAAGLRLPRRSRCRAPTSPAARSPSGGP